MEMTGQMFGTVAECALGSPTAGQSHGSSPAPLLIVTPRVRPRRQPSDGASTASYPCGRCRLNAQLLDSGWLSPGSCEHLGNEPARIEPSLPRKLMRKIIANRGMKNKNRSKRQDKQRVSSTREDLDSSVC